MKALTASVIFDFGICWEILCLFTVPEERKMPLAELPYMKKVLHSVEAGDPGSGYADAGCFRWGLFFVPQKWKIFRWKFPILFQGYPLKSSIFIRVAMGIT